jgi:peptide/nickel transport system permease protein
VSLVPGIAIFRTVMGFNCLGDGQRDALDPRMRARLSE